MLAVVPVFDWLTAVLAFSSRLPMHLPRIGADHADIAAIVAQIVALRAKPFAIQAAFACWMLQSSNDQMPTIGN